MIKRITRSLWAFRILLFPFKFLRTFFKRNSAKLAALLTFSVVILLISNTEHRSLVAVENSIREENLPNEKINLTHRTTSSTRSAPKENDNKPKENEGNESQPSLCPEHPPELVGNMTVDPYLKTTFEEVEKVAGHELRTGGCYVPTCVPRQKVAIIIPFKDRDAHLRTLLYYLHPMLMRQKIQYCIYVAEQYDFGQFNKALVMNAAFVEALKLDRYSCVVFHDVDMIPENDFNIYSCGTNPKHLSPAIDKFDYRPHYGTDFGGVTAISPVQYRKANGHSNRFWGWGGEDNDMEFRIQRKGLKIIPSSMNIGRYKMIPHRHSWQFSQGSLINILNETREKRADMDGLSDLQYRMMGIERYPTYTKIFIDLRLFDFKKITWLIDGEPVMDVDLKLDQCRWDLYSGKYLDKNIFLPKSEMEKALLLPPNEQLPMPKEKKWVDPKNAKKKNKELPIPEPTKEKPAPITNLKDAQKICEALAPECRGVLEDKKTSLYLLRHGGVPRNLVVSAIPHNSNGQKQYFFANKNVYLKYCPGMMGYLQAFETPIHVTIEDNKPEGWHRYKFVIEFSVLLRPTDKTLYFYGVPYLEGQIRRDVNVSPFRWPSLKFPDFDDPRAIRDFKFETLEFSLPNIPGSYLLESKIMGKDRSPYFNWKIWFEVKSEDKTEDAKVRDTFVNNQREEQLAQLAAKRQKMMGEEPKDDVVDVVPRAKDNQHRREKREKFFKDQMQKMEVQNARNMVERGLLKDYNLNVASIDIQNQQSNFGKRGVHKPNNQNDYEKN